LIETHKAISKTDLVSDSSPPEYTSLWDTEHASLFDLKLVRSASTSLRGWFWIAAAFAGTWIDIRMRPWFGLPNP
tara:strand:- start:585 stop:809 length:225 start_codon:yes stop_codon:yes gene_type:complete